MTLLQSRAFGIVSPLVLLTLAALLFLFPAAAPALIIVQKGNDPIEKHMGPGATQLPAGSVAVADLKTRLGWWEGPPFGGGLYTFEYRGDVKAFQEAVDLFAKIKAPALEIHVRPEMHNTGFFADPKDPKADTRVDWSFIVWNPANWNRLAGMAKGPWNAQMGKDLPAPRLDVYIGKDGKGGIDWKAVTVPAGVTVIDERASAHGYNDGSVFIADVQDLTTSKPLAGAKVVLMNDDTTIASGTTDAKGHVELRKISEGVHRALVSSDGMATRLVSYVTFGSDTYRSVQTGLAPAAEFSGITTDKDGKPLAGVTVRADAVLGPDGLGYATPADGAQHPTTTSDAQGKFKFTDLPKGSLRIYAYSKTHLLMNGLKTFNVPADNNVTLAMTGTGTVKVTVAQADGSPAAGNYSTEIAPEGGRGAGTWSGNATIGQKGTYSFEGVPAGKYIVSARPNPGNVNDPGDPKVVEVKPGETTELLFTTKK